MSKRFVIERESGNDYCIFDTARGIAIASGLTEEEAKQGAANRELEIKDAKQILGVVG
jgi:hypothetical protein